MTLSQPWSSSSVVICPCCRGETRFASTTGNLWNGEHACGGFSVVDVSNFQSRRFISRYNVKRRLEVGLGISNRMPSHGCYPIPNPTINISQSPDMFRFRIYRGLPTMDV